MSGPEMAALAAELRRPRATEVEQQGIDTIPDAERTSGPFHLLRIQFGGANTFATLILGIFAVLLELSLVQVPDDQISPIGDDPRASAHRAGRHSPAASEPVA